VGHSLAAERLAGAAERVPVVMVERQAVLFRLSLSCSP